MFTITTLQQHFAKTSFIQKSRIKLTQIFDVQFTQILKNDCANH